MNAITSHEVSKLAEIPNGVSADDFPFEVFTDIVVIEQAVEEKSAGGIIFVGEDKKLPCGRVVAVGPGRIYTTELNASGSVAIAHFVPTKVKVGDFVTFGRYQTGEPIEYNGKKYLVCREGDLAGKSKDGSEIMLRLAKVD